MTLPLSASLGKLSILVVTANVGSSSFKDNRFRLPIRSNYEINEKDKFFDEEISLFTEALPSKGDGGMSGLLRIDSSFSLAPLLSPSLPSSFSSSIRTIDGCVIVVGSRFLIQKSIKSNI